MVPRRRRRPGLVHRRTRPRGRRAGWATRGADGLGRPGRAGIREALRDAARAGIAVVVVTGDHPRTAASVARAAGLGDERIVTGAEMGSWDDARLGAELPSLHVV